MSAAPPTFVAPVVASVVASVVAFDTSTERLALALQSPAGARLLNAPGGAAASATLLPQFHALLAEAGLKPRELGLVAFGRGPGAFTGLRTACAVAQGLAFGLGIPVLPVDSLVIVADDALEQAAARAARWRVGVAMDARMDEVYAGAYEWSGSAWRVLAAPALMDLAAFASAWQGLALDAVAGSAWPAFGSRIAASAPVFPHEADRAAALLRLALQGAAAGEGVDAALALPLYLRDKVALTTREREAAKAASAAAA